MDADSNYMAISGNKLEDIVRPELRARIRDDKEAVADLGQVERAHARAVQTGI